MSAKTTKQSKSTTSVLERELNKLFSTEQVTQIMSLVNAHERKRRTRAVKDPNAPKRWSTNYILFCQERRESVVKEFPTANATEITSRLGKAWSALSENEKKKYTELAQRDKERYERELAVYNSQNGKVTTSASVSETKPKRQTKTEKTEKTATEDSAAETKTSSKSRTNKAKTEKSKAVPQSQSSSSKQTKQSASETTVEKKQRNTSTKTEKTPGFANFASETREEVETENPSLSKRKVDEELLNRWNKLTEEDRALYDSLAEEEEEEF